MANSNLPAIHCIYIITATLETWACFMYIILNTLHKRGGGGGGGCGGGGGGAAVVVVVVVVVAAVVVVVVTIIIKSGKVIPLQARCGPEGG